MLSLRKSMFFTLLYIGILLFGEPLSLQTGEFQTDEGLAQTPTTANADENILNAT